MENTGLETAIQERGKVLLADIKPERLITLTPAWWQEQMLTWANSDPAFRVKLLQFVDVLPSLRTSAAVADHVRQYFRDGGPAVTELGANLASRKPFRPVLSRVVRGGVHAMADRFIAGETPAESIPHLRDLASEGVAHTVDLLGEATLSDAEAEVYTDRYEDLVRTLAREAARWDADPAIRQPCISIKLSALTAHFEPAAPEATAASLRPRLERVFGAARECGALVYVDMEQFRYRDLVHHVFADVLASGDFASWDGAGIVVQAYLRDAEADIERLQSLSQRRGAPIHVRLVKGAYWDEETIVAEQEGHAVPVFERKAETDASFERCTARLVAAYPHLKPAIASHHPRSVAQAMVRLEAAGLPRDDVEFQVLYGMAEGLRGAVVRQGYRTRVYVPSGEIIPGMAYLVRRLLENTSNESWLLHRHEQPDASVLESSDLDPPEEPLTPPESGFRNHPHAEFHVAAEREAMQEAVAKAPANFGQAYPAVVAGHRAETAEWDTVEAPAHPGMAIGRVARSTPSMAAEAVAAAREAHPGWRDRPAVERAHLLRVVAATLAERRFQLAALMVYESAKPWREADGDVTEAIDFLRYYALQAEDLEPGGVLEEVPAERNALRFEGRGVVAVIAPWNFPLAILTGMTAGALAAGCPVVVKPAEQSPIIAATLVGIMHEVGIPGDVLHFLPGPGEVVGDALVRNPDIAMVAFTGSREVGLSIVEAAAHTPPGQRHIKRVIAELGGKNAIIVDDDADLDQAVAGVVTSAFGFAGQKCSACSRVIVVGTAYDEFRKRLAAAVESLPVGEPENPYTFVPPVISSESRDRIMRYIETGLREAELVARGNTPGAPGHYVAPHVFENIAADSPLTREEIFGPVLGLYRARNFGDAIQQALDSDYALTGGVYSRNPRHIRQATAQFRVGNFYINRPITGSMVGRQPFAGFALSGTGEKAGGPGYVRQFTNPRVVTENTMRRGFAPE